jgi:hypothetical protein
MVVPGIRDMYIHFICSVNFLFSFGDNSVSDFTTLRLTLGDELPLF